jgi:hypothetical protein
MLLGMERKVSDEGLAQIGSGLLEPGAVLLVGKAITGVEGEFTQSAATGGLDVGLNQAADVPTGLF